MQQRRVALYSHTQYNIASPTVLQLSPIKSIIHKILQWNLNSLYCLFEILKLHRSKHLCSLPATNSRIKTYNFYHRNGLLAGIGVLIAINKNYHSELINMQVVILLMSKFKILYLILGDMNESHTSWRSITNKIEEMSSKRSLKTLMHFSSILERPPI